MSNLFEPLMAEFFLEDLTILPPLAIYQKSIKVDYLSAEKTTITILSLNEPLIRNVAKEAKYIRIRGIYSGEERYAGIVESFTKNENVFEVDCLPILSIFDKNFMCGFGPAVADKLGINDNASEQLAIAMMGFLKNVSPYATFEEVFSTLMPVSVQAVSGSPENKIYIKQIDLRNIFEAICDLFKLYQIVCTSKIYQSAPIANPDGSIKITISYLSSEKTKTLDTTLPNILSLEVTDEQENSVNILTVINKDKFPAVGSIYPSENIVRTYARLDNGLIVRLDDAGTLNFKHVSQDTITAEDEDFTSGNVDNIAVGELTLANYDKTVIVELAADDTLIPFGTFQLGEEVDVKTDSGTSRLQFTAYEITDNSVKYTFGNGRTTLTQKLRKEREKST